MRTLVVRLSSIGDVVHALPALAALKRHGHSAGFLVEPAALPLVWDNPALAYCGRVPPRREFSWHSARAALRQVRRQRFEVALDMQGLWKSAAWARLSGARRSVGWAGPARREGLSSLLLHETLPAPDVRHVIDLNLALLRAVGVDAVGSREFVLPEDPQAAAAVPIAPARRKVRICMSAFSRGCQAERTARPKPDIS